MRLGHRHGRKRSASRALHQPGGEVVGIPLRDVPLQPPRQGVGGPVLEFRVGHVRIVMERMAGWQDRQLIPIPLQWTAEMNTGPFRGYGEIRRGIRSPDVSTKASRTMDRGSCWRRSGCCNRSAFLLAALAIAGYFGFINPTRGVRTLRGRLRCEVHDALRRASDRRKSITSTMPAIGGVMTAARVQFKGPVKVHGAAEVRTYDPTAIANHLPGWKYSNTSGKFIAATRRQPGSTFPSTAKCGCFGIPRGVEGSNQDTAMSGISMTSESGLFSGQRGARVYGR